MKNRRDFLKLAATAGLGLTGAGLGGSLLQNRSEDNVREAGINPVSTPEDTRSIIGDYGPWANSKLEERGFPEFSLRRQNWGSLDEWRNRARKQMEERLAIPVLEQPEVRIVKNYIYDGLHIEELKWELPYGRTTDAILLKPEDATGPLPGILAFYEHGLQKFFGVHKITRTNNEMHPILENHYKEYYDGLAWANEIAKRGYVVLVADVFPFGSRRVRLDTVPDVVRSGLEYKNPNRPTRSEIQAYNDFAMEHEHVLAKSLFSAGMTWPGVYISEDRVALDILCAREDVDENRIGCGGLSGGGIRTVMTGGLDPRIKCAVCVCFMTTWSDLILYKSHTHTWMAFAPLLPNDLEFTEILGLRAPMPTLVLNAEDDPLFTHSEMKRADSIMKEVYQLAGAEDHYQCSFHPGVHKFGKEMQQEAFSWFDRWLGPQAS